MAEQVEIVAVEAERLSNLLDLVDEARDRPQRRIVRLVAVGRAELVVEVVLDARGGQVVCEPLEVLMGRTGTAVEQQQLDARIPADTLRPDAEVAPGCRDRDHPHAVSVVDRHVRTLPRQSPHVPWTRPGQRHAPSPASSGAGSGVLEVRVSRATARAARASRANRTNAANPTSAMTTSDQRIPNATTRMPPTFGAITMARFWIVWSTELNVTPCSVGMWRMSWSNSASCAAAPATPITNPAAATAGN